jgi:hypothetical protein
MMDGRSIFQGRAPAAIEYLGQRGYQCPANHNPSDFFMIILSGHNPNSDYISALVDGKDEKTPEANRPDSIEMHQNFSHFAG